jgi:AcrR family transcriptional regulator
VRDASGGRQDLRRARTRQQIRAAAHQLFAERGFDGVTTADVAAAAQVAVQTVFNHFESKEALFFDGRTPRVAGPAAAVLERPPGTGPLTALRCYVERDLTAMLVRESQPEHRAYVEALVSCPVLGTGERALVGRAAEQVTDALVVALAGTPSDVPAEVRMLSRVTAETMLCGARAVAVEHRLSGLRHGRVTPVDPAAVLPTVQATYAVLEDGVRQLADRLGVLVD